MCEFVENIPKIGIEHVEMSQDIFFSKNLLSYPEDIPKIPNQLMNSWLDDGSQIFLEIFEPPWAPMTNPWDDC